MPKCLATAQGNTGYKTDYAVPRFIVMLTVLDSIIKEFPLMGNSCVVWHFTLYCMFVEEAGQVSLLFFVVLV